ncbi:BRCT domain-containing protein [Enterococcus faecalis]|uniref:BRCT domain-containing protein n=1 Tax=Enterococcus faecalis TaxID=1351 RepID=UPI0035CA16EB
MNEVFVFTGTLDCFTRKQAQNLAEALGGQSQQTVTKESTCLVTGKQSLILFCSEESAKRKQAKIKRLKILSEEEFIELCIDQLVKYRNIKTESR